MSAVGALATGSLAGFLTVAGGIAGSIGLITGKKSLQRIGGLMALGGGIVGLAQGSFGAAIDSAASSASGAQEAANAAWQAGGAAEAAAMQAAGPGDIASGVGRLWGETPTLGLEAPSIPVSGVQPSQAGMTWTDADANALSAINRDDVPQSLFARADSYAAQQANAPSQAAYQRVVEANGAPVSAQAPMEPAVPGGRLEQEAVKLTPQELANTLQKQKSATQAALGKVSQFMRDNKELVQMGGNALAAMYGPAAEKMDWEKSLYARRVGNLNRPVVLTSGGP